jgi:histidine ammonia-lyase
MLLRASHEQFRAVVANIPGVVYRCGCDVDWTIRFISEDIVDLVGYPASDFLDNRVRRYGSLIYPPDRPRVIVEIDRALEQGAPYSLSYRLVHADGSIRWISEQGRAVLGDNGERAWLDGVILDISERVLAEQARDRAQQALGEQAQLNRYQARHDSLTALPNRVLFGEQVGRAIEAAASGGGEFALLLIDLDRFKEINDTLGHGAGDAFLTAVAMRVRGVLRAVDSIARLGGDEFACLIPGADAAAAIAVAQRIREAIYEPLVLDELPLQVETSIGIAIFPEHGANEKVLLQRADVAMYTAKGGGDGQSVYDPRWDTRAPASLALVSELTRALAERELVLHYQPKIALRTGRVTGVEALVRWQHPTRGLVSPDQFIPVAQETGLIRPLTLYVIDEALRQCQEWRDCGHELAVAVNVSMRNLVDARFPTDIQELLAQRNMPAALLGLEITETAIVADPYRTRAVLERLAAMGIRLAVDDFGTGYTSLAYLKRLPVRELKIDRSFVGNMMRDDDDAVIVRSTIDLGQNLGLEVVAEGVEDADTLAGLEALGCDLAQGYYMSHPIAGDALMNWLECLPASAGDSQWRDEKVLEQPILVGRGRLRIEDVVRAATGATVELDEGARDKMAHSRRVLESALDDDAPIYGLTTGVGAQKMVAVNSAEQERFNRLMVRAHCVGHGELAPPQFVRAAMFVRSEGLAQGAAGARPEVVETLLAALNAGFVPSVHMLGSLGQSDLSPLAEIARALIGEGPNAAQLRDAGLPALRLAAGEGLALISANAFAIGVAALAAKRAERALSALELSAALAFEGFAANVCAIDPAVGSLRPQAGVQHTIGVLRGLLAGGALLEGDRPPRSLQDPLCFRVLPQTHGATHTALSHIRSTVETELRSASDNPAVLTADGLTLANGNHDSTALAVALDHARLGLAQSVTIANERIQKLLDERFSGLPTGLRAGTDIPDDGLGAVGHGASALAAEARLLAAPTTLEQPTSSAATGVEDRITLAPVGARRLHEMAGYTIRLAAVELLCAAQAVDLAEVSGRLGQGAAAAYEIVRSHAAFTGPGQAPSDDLEPLVDWLETR